MILTIFGLAFVLPTVIRAIRSEQASDVGHSFRTRATISQVQVSLQSQGPSSNLSNTNQVFKTSLGPKCNGSVSGISQPECGEVEIAVSDPAPLAAALQTATAPPLISFSTIASSSGTTSGAVLGTESASQKTELTKNRITSSPTAKSTDLPALIVGSQTIEANSQNEYTLVQGQTSTPASTTSITPQTLPTQSQLAFDSSSSHLFHIAPTSAVSQLPSLLTLDGQNITASSPGQYNVNGHTLMPGIAATFSGTPTSLAPNASGNDAANKTKSLSANITTASRSGPVGTNVPIFTGGVQRARDGLWSSSIALLVGIAVLLWL